MSDAEVLAARADDHRDLFERAVPRALADPVHGNLDLPGAVLDPGQRVRDRQTEVVVTVGRDHDVVGNGLADGPHQLAELAGRRVAHRVRDVDRGGPARDRDAEALQEEVELGPGRILRGELDILRVALR